MKICKLCDRQVTESDAKLTIDGKYYECDYCGELTHELDLKYDTSNNWKPSFKPPCKTNTTCDSVGNCNRNKCISYGIYQLNKAKKDLTDQADRNIRRIVTEFKTDAMVYNRCAVGRS